MAEDLNGIPDIKNHLFDVKGYAPSYWDPILRKAGKGQTLKEKINIFKTDIYSLSMTFYSAVTKTRLYSSKINRDPKEYPPLIAEILKLNYPLPVK